MATKRADDVSIGKFDILATYTYAKALLDGLTRTRPGSAGWSRRSWAPRPSSATRHAPRLRDDKEAAEKKKKTTITAESFDHQVAGKMGGFFKTTFLPAIKRLVEADLSYDEVKRLVKIPSTWGAKITGEQFKERAVVPD